MRAPNKNDPRPEDTQTQWVVADAAPAGLWLAGPAVSGTTVLSIGRANEAGFVLRAIEALPSVSIGASTTSYHLFRPFVVTTDRGVATTRYVGTGRGTNAYNLVASVPLRIHDEEFLNERLPKGAQVGVEITTVSAGSGQPNSVRISFQAGLIKHGR